MLITFLGKHLSPECSSSHPFLHRHIFPSYRSFPSPVVYFCLVTLLGSLICPQRVSSDTNSFRWLFSVTFFLWTVDHPFFFFVSLWFFISAFCASTVIYLFGGVKGEKPEHVMAWVSLHVMIVPLLFSRLPPGSTVPVSRGGQAPELNPRY
jgi:hypothetical protein